MNKFYIVALFSLLCLPISAFAAGCPETSIHEAAKANRNAYIKELYDTAIQNPEDTRSQSACLSSIESIGDIFSFGVSLPSVDELIGQICAQVDSILQEQINGAINLATTTVQEASSFEVVANPQDMVSDLINSLK